MTRIGSYFSNDYKGFASNSQITLNGADTHGANLIFDALQPFVSGYTYALSVLISLGPGVPLDVYPKASSTRVCIAETGNNAVARYNNPSQFPCTNAYVTNTIGSPGWWNVTDGTQDLRQYGLLTYVFTADFTATAITLSYNSSQPITSFHAFGGYVVEVLSDNKNISQDEIKQAVQSSGIATATDANQIKVSIDEVKQEINGMQQEQQQTNEKLDDLNDNITNDNVSGIEDAFSRFDGFISENSTITQLITMPITLYSSILKGVQSACQPFSLGSLFGTNLTFPCINIGNYLGTALWTMIDVIISGFAIFSISKKLIKIFNNFSSMKEGDVIDD